MCENEKIKILSWNVNRFSKTKDIKKFIEYIKDKKAHVITLQEFTPKNFTTFQVELTDYKCIIHNNVKQWGNAGVVFLAVHNSIFKNNNFQGNSFEKFARWTEVCISTNSKTLNILCIHVPIPSYKKDKNNKNVKDNQGNFIIDDKSIESKAYFWNYILLYAQAKKDENTIIIGDFNTFLPIDANKNNARSILSGHLNTLKDIGYYDVWQRLNPDKKEFTWYYDGNINDGRRLDYSFVSEKLQADLACHDHDVNTAQHSNGLSDHSALVIEVRV